MQNYHTFYPEVSITKAFLVMARNFTLLGLFLFPAFNLMSQDANSLATDKMPVTISGTAENPDEWQIIASPYLWMPVSVEGDSTVNGGTVSLDLDLDDILDLLNFGVSGRVEAWKKNWGIILDGSYVDLEGEEKTPINKIDVDIDESIVDLMGAKRIDYVNLSADNEAMMLSLEAQAGGRYHYLKQKIELSPGPNLGKSKDWVEPVIGARAIFQVTEKLSFVLRGDAGGFGIGSASDLTLNGLAGTSYRIRENIDLRMGYKVNYIDYSNGSGPDEFGWDATLHGPYLSAGFHF